MSESRIVLSARQLQRSEVVASRYTVPVAGGTPMAAVLHPEFWVHHCRMLKPMDVLEVIAADGSYELTLRVTRVEPLYAKVRVIGGWTLAGGIISGVFGPSADLTEAGATLTGSVLAAEPNAGMGSRNAEGIASRQQMPREPIDGSTAMPADIDELELHGYKVNWGGRSHRFRVIDATGNVIKHGFEDKPAASAFLMDYIRQQAI